MLTHMFCQRQTAIQSSNQLMHGCCSHQIRVWQLFISACMLQYLAAELPAGTTADPTAGFLKVWLVIAYVMTVLTVLLLLFTLVMLRRIKIAVATLKVGLMESRQLWHFKHVPFCCWQHQHCHILLRSSVIHSTLHSAYVGFCLCTCTISI